MEILKEYRFEKNPNEQEFYEKFLKLAMGNSFQDLDSMVFGTTNGLDPKDRLTERERQIVLGAIQWLGSPLGEGFLHTCGYQFKPKSINEALNKTLENVGEEFDVFRKVSTMTRLNNNQSVDIQVVKGYKSWTASCTVNNEKIKITRNTRNAVIVSMEIRLINKGYRVSNLEELLKYRE